MGLLDDEIQIARNAHAKLMAEVDDARRLLAEREHEAAIAAARLEGLERAAELLALPSGHPLLSSPEERAKRTNKVNRPASKGRQFGAISKKWRAVLAGMAARHPSGATDDEIAYLGKMGEIPNLRPRDARRQMEKYRQQGFVERDEVSETWIITEMAAAKFGFQSPESEATADSRSTVASELSSAERV